MVDGCKPSSKANDSAMVEARVLKGLEDADAGRMVSTEELLKQVQLWETNWAEGPRPGRPSRCEPRVKPWVTRFPPRF
jgi:hypothetical protein